MRRRKDTFVKANSIADIEELVSIATNQKENHEATENLLKRKIEEISKSILVVRDDFLTFLKSNSIDPNYPVISDVVSDSVVPDTVPSQSMGVVPIEEAMLPNIPNSTFLITMKVLQEKYVTLQDEIEEYADTLYKMKLQKAKLEAKLDSVKKSIEEYQDKIKENQPIYNDSIKNLDKIKSLYQNLLDFRSLIFLLPDTFTTESYIKFQNSYFDRYSVNYWGKKKSIRKFAGILQDTYKPTIADQMEQGFYMVVFRDISVYFGPFEETINNLPDKYLDAMPKKIEIISKMDEFSESLNKLISNVKMSLDAIRGVKGIGNSLVEGLIASTNEVANSFAAQKKVEHTTLESVSNDNYTINLSINQNIKYIKSMLQRGANNLDDKFMKTSSKFLRKIAITFGFPLTFLYDRTINLEDHVRERVRRKYGGNIPFCDENVVINSTGTRTFVKKSEIDPRTGKSLTDSQGDALEKSTRNDSSLLSKG
jgi:hypothetical protein